MWVKPGSQESLPPLHPGVSCYLVKLGEEGKTKPISGGKKGGLYGVPSHEADKQQLAFGHKLQFCNPSAPISENFGIHRTGL